jgi:hypothetical protein
MATTWVRKVVRDEGALGAEWVDSAHGLAGWTSTSTDGSSSRVTLVDLVEDAVVRIAGVAADAFAYIAGGGPGGGGVIAAVHPTGGISLIPREVFKTRGVQSTTLDDFLGTPADDDGSGLYSTPLPGVLRGAAARAALFHEDQGADADTDVGVAVAWPAYDAATRALVGHVVGRVAAGASRAVLVPSANAAVYLDACAFSPDGRLFAAVDAGRAYVADVSGGSDGSEDDESSSSSSSSTTPARVAPVQVLATGRCRPLDVAPAFTPAGDGVLVMAKDTAREWGAVVMLFGEGRRRGGDAGGGGVVGCWDAVEWV